MRSSRSGDAWMRRLKSCRASHGSLPLTGARCAWPLDSILVYMRRSTRRRVHRWQVSAWLQSAILRRISATGREARVTPKIFYTFSSTEYWARAGSLSHTTEDGTKDVPLAATSRLYFLAGTPHSSGLLSSTRSPAFQHFSNFAQQRWVARALLLDLDAWTRNGTEPPSSRYPSIAKSELVPLAGVHFP